MVAEMNMGIRNKANNQNANSQLDKGYNKGKSAPPSKLTPV
jgi:hypothetical protein